MAEINAVYHAAAARAARGERTVSSSVLTGVQALERKHPGLPLAPGKVERREFEYPRHGTRAFILSRDVVSGRVVAPSVGPTRTEADFLAHLQGVVATDPATRVDVPAWCRMRGHEFVGSDEADDGTPRHLVRRLR